MMKIEYLTCFPGYNLNRIGYTTQAVLESTGNIWMRNYDTLIENEIYTITCQSIQNKDNSRSQDRDVMNMNDTMEMDMDMDQ